jgi:signal transduction histidine kinase
VNRSRSGSIPARLEMTVFRIVQEALTNIHRHARTSEAFVRIHLELASLLVEIEDREVRELRISSLLIGCEWE